MKKIAIVTGGGRGIGFGIAKALSKDNYTVCLMGSSDKERYADALNELSSFGNEVFYFKGSISENDDRISFVNSVIEKYGRIDLLVNNAGVAPKIRLDILETTEESFDYVIGINLKGTMFLTQLVARQMISQEETDGKKGTIINISSFSSTVSSPNRAEYCVSKAGISMLTKLFADRLAPENIFVYEIQPGIIRTDMTSKVTEKYDRLLSGPDFPIHRWGTPEDIANAVMVFAGGKITYTTGQVLNIDGGYMNVRSI